MAKSDFKYRDACASSLLHDLSVARSCVAFHSLNTFNPFSRYYKKRLSDLAVMIDLLYKDIDDDFSNRIPIDDDFPF